MAIVIDSFLAPEESQRLWDQLPQPLLEEGQERRLLTADVPLDLEQRIQRALLGDACPHPPCQGPLSGVVDAETSVSVPVPTRIATGSVPMHQDCFNPFDAAETNFIDGYVAVIYLSGAGVFTVDDGSGELPVNIASNRLVAWHNGRCKHRLDAQPGEGPRVMLGPVAVNTSGFLQRAHDVWSTHPGYINSCKSKAEEAEKAGDPAGALKELRTISTFVSAERLAELEKQVAEKKEGKKLCLTLTIEQDPESSGVVVVASGMGGERVATVPVEEPWSIKVETVEAKLSDAIAKASKSDVYTLALVLPDATLLSEDHKKQTIEEVFGKPETAAAGAAKASAAESASSSV